MICKKCPHREKCLLAGVVSVDYKPIKDYCLIEENIDFMKLENVKGKRN